MDSPQTCGVCFDDLATCDVENPLLCPTTNCNFNMCTRCTSHLVESSKSGYEMASDGNMHVKVKLQCPSCRGDFSSTIEDVLLLRTAIQMYESYQHIPDTELSSSDLQIKYTYTLSFIEDIKMRLELKQRLHSTSEECRENTLEALFYPNTRIPIDKALFSGLESVMTVEEQLFVTQFMTSGDSKQLAQAAQILSGIGTVVRRGYRAESALEMTFPGTPSDHAKIQSQLKKHFSLHPLPHFMPLFISMDADFNVYAKHGKLLKFQDDEWDGSIADGFARAIQDNVLNDSLDEEDDGEEEEEEEEEEVTLVNTSRLSENIGKEKVSPSKGKRRNRVIVRKARYKAAAMGITAGMVVTHFNGEEFCGTAEELKQSLYKLYLTEQSFTMVLNADSWTAEALKQRGNFEID